MANALHPSTMGRFQIPSRCMINNSTQSGKDQHPCISRGIALVIKARLYAQQTSCRLRGVHLHRMHFFIHARSRTESPCDARMRPLLRKSQTVRKSTCMPSSRMTSIPTAAALCRSDDDAARIASINAASALSFDPRSAETKLSARYGKLL